MREEIGPVAAFKTVMTVKRLPKTRSGKILRGTMRQIADGEAWKMPATIDDPAILDEITGAMQERGMARGSRRRWRSPAQRSAGPCLATRRLISRSTAATRQTFCK